MNPILWAVHRSRLSFLLKKLNLFLESCTFYNLYKENISNVNKSYSLSCLNVCDINLCDWLKFNRNHSINVRNCTSVSKTHQLISFSYGYTVCLVCTYYQVWIMINVMHNAIDSLITIHPQCSKYNRLTFLFNKKFASIKFSYF